MFAVEQEEVTPRPHDRREGDHRRVPPARRDPHHRGRSSSRSSGPYADRADLLPRPHLQREPARLRRRDGEPEALPRAARPRSAARRASARWPARCSRSRSTRAWATCASAASWSGSSWCAIAPTRGRVPVRARAGHRACLRRAGWAHPAPARQRGGADAAARHDRGRSWPSWGASRSPRSTAPPPRSTARCRDARAVRHRDRHRRRQDRGGLRLVRGPRARGLDVGAMKPAQSGRAPASPSTPIGWAPLRDGPIRRSSSARTASPCRWRPGSRRGWRRRSISARPPARDRGRARRAPRGAGGGGGGRAASRRSRRARPTPTWPWRWGCRRWSWREQGSGR